eukprot:TRINITY_DN20838_c0_g1_i1.p1 TRINITY_DN20838_c0_g1~~TRINITY_DN20838_c0_g1_i1.p1  ORF type:complete len:155 (+),score=49.78 TRINITY_DN20838_c0_g1_i1:29-466(+)
MDDEDRWREDRSQRVERQIKEGRMSLDALMEVIHQGRGVVTPVRRRSPVLKNTRAERLTNITNTMAASSQASQPSPQPLDLDQSFSFYSPTPTRGPRSSYHPPSLACDDSKPNEVSPSPLKPLQPTVRSRSPCRAYLDDTMQSYF